VRAKHSLQLQESRRPWEKALLPIVCHTVGRGVGAVVGAQGEVVGDWLLDKAVELQENGATARQCRHHEVNGEPGEVDIVEEQVLNARSAPFSIPYPRTVMLNRIGIRSGWMRAQAVKTTASPMGARVQVKMKDRQPH
jgi:hypothetical protein